MKKKKIAITETDELEKEWFEEAKKQTLKTLPAFIDHVMNDYIHDYGTVCHAVSACALAAAWAADKSDGGGLTSFQAGFVMWDFIKQWTFPYNKCGLKIIDYDDMLYPQYADKYGKTISPYVWECLQKEAKNLLGTDDLVHPSVMHHWRLIADGKVPFGYKVVDN